MGLAFAARGVCEVVRAGLDHPFHALTEPIVNVHQPRFATLVFNAVV